MRPSEQQRGQAQLSLDLQTLRAVLEGGNPQLAASALAALQHAAHPAPVHSQAPSAMRVHHHLQPLPSALMPMNPTSTSTPPAPPVTQQQLQLLMLLAQQQQQQNLLAQQHTIQHQHHQQLPRMHATMPRAPAPILGTTTATTAAWPQDEDSVRHTEMSSLASAMVEAVLGPAACGATTDTQTLDAPPPAATWTTHARPQRPSAWSTSGTSQQPPARSMSPSFSLPAPMATLTQQQQPSPSTSTINDARMPHPRSPVPAAEHAGETVGGELLPTPFGLSGSTAPFVTSTTAPATAPPSIAPGDGSPSSLSSACSSLLTGTGGSRSSDVLLSSSNSNLVAQASVPLGGHTGRTGSEADTLFPPQRPSGTHLCKSLSQHRHDHRPAPPPALAVGSLHPDDPLRFKAPNQSRRQGRDRSGPPAAFAPPLLNAQVQQQLIRQLQEELADARRQLAEALQAQARCTCGSGGGNRQDARGSQAGGAACASGSKAEEPPARVDAQQQQQQQAEEEDMTAAAHAAAMRALLPMLGGAGGGAGAATKPSSAAIPSTNTVSNLHLLQGQWCCDGVRCSWLSFTVWRCLLPQFASLHTSASKPNCACPMFVVRRRRQVRPALPRQAAGAHALAASHVPSAQPLRLPPTTTPPPTPWSPARSTWCAIPPSHPALRPPPLQTRTRATTRRPPTCA